MNGRRLRRIRPEKIHKMNREIQNINESIVHCGKLLDSTERTVYSGDWLKGHRADTYQHQTWRSVGYLNLTDHFLARYLERIKGIKFDMRRVAELFGVSTIRLNEQDGYKVKYAYQRGLFDDEQKSEIREFVKNPPDGVRVVRREDRVITLLMGDEE